MDFKKIYYNWFTWYAYTGILNMVAFWRNCCCSYEVLIHFDILQLHESYICVSVCDVENSFNSSFILITIGRVVMSHIIWPSNPAQWIVNFIFICSKLKGPILWCSDRIHIFFLLYFLFDQWLFFFISQNNNKYITTNYIYLRSCYIQFLVRVS